MMSAAPAPSAIAIAPDPSSAPAVAAAPVAAAPNAAAAPVAAVPNAAASIDVKPLLVALDVLAADAADEGTGLTLSHDDYSDLSAKDFTAMAENVVKVSKMLRVIKANEPCLFSVIQTTAGR